MERTGTLTDYKNKHLALHEGTMNVPLRTVMNPTRAVCTLQTIRIPAKHGNNTRRVTDRGGVR